MSSNIKPSKAKALAGVQALIAGTQKHLPTAIFTIGNATIAAPALLQVLQGLVEAMAKQNEAKAAAKDALTALVDAQTKANPVVLGYRTMLVAMYGSASQTLADFGLAPRKVRAPLTVEQKVAAKAKAKATRTARGTKGPKAKLEIKGTVPTQTPVTANAPVASPAKPTT